jgi:hypothetical protein
VTLDLLLLGVYVDALERATLGWLSAKLPERSAECTRQSAAQHPLLEGIERLAQCRQPVRQHLFMKLLERDLGNVRRLIGTGLLGHGGGHAHEERFGCPDGACDWRADTSLAGPPPLCNDGKPMLRV